MPETFGMEESREWLVRYRRQITLEGFGIDAQRALNNSHVVVIGAGGLGAPALLYLAAAGIGRITVIDDDLVELSNLHRQVIHREDSIGQSKAESAATEMRARNSSVIVRAVRARLDHSNAKKLLEDADLVLDGSDNFATRYAVSHACAARQVPHVWGSILGFDAQLSVFWAGHGPIYDDVFPEAPPEGSVPSCAEAGVIGPLVGIIGTAMALETVKILSGVGEPLTGTVAYFSGGTGRWEYIPIAGDPEVARRVAKSELPASDTSEQRIPATAQNAHASAAPTAHAEATPDIPAGLLIDVREPSEFQTFHIPGAQNIPLSRLRAGVEKEIEEQLRKEQQQGTEITIYCAAGVRSAEAMQMFRKAGIDGLNDYPGGINAWLDQQNQ